MQYAELYVNDQLLDLPTDSLIALTYAVNTLTDLKSVQGNISNSISLPDTAGNRAALGYPEDLNFNGAYLIRQKLPCRYVQNGVDVLPQANLRIVGASKGELKIVLSSGNTDFFDLLTGKLRDLDFSEYDHLWNQANVIAARTNTQGYTYPVINYGNLNNNGSDIHGQAIYAAEMRPAVFVSTLVEKIITQAGILNSAGVNIPAGYTFNNQLLADPVTAPIYQNLLLPFCDDKFVHSDRFINAQIPNNLQAQLITQPPVFTDPTNNGTDRVLVFDDIVSDALNTFNGTYFTAPEDMTVSVDLAFDKILSTSYNKNHLDGAYYELYTNTGGTPQYITRGQTTINSSDHITSSSPDYYQTTYTNFHVTANSVTLKKGDSVWMNIGSLYGCSQTIIPKVTLTISRVTDMIYGQETVQVESVLPDMGTTDFLKFIQFFFCAVIQTDNINKVVSIVPFGHIMQNMPFAVDWSDKLTNDGEDFDVQVGDYCQQNEAKWKQDDTVSPDTFGNGSFYLDDQNLDLYQDIYDLPFAATYDAPVLGNNNTSFINKIPDTNVTDQNGAVFSTQTEDRVLLLNSVNTSINFREGGSTNYTTISGSIPFTYFTSLGGTPDLTLPSIFANHYPDLVNVLNDQRKLTCYFNLTEIDIQTLDFFYPVYIAKYQCYFYISKITDFTGTKPVKVDLVRL